MLSKQALLDGGNTYSCYAEYDNAPNSSYGQRVGVNLGRGENRPKLLPEMTFRHILETWNSSECDVEANIKTGWTPLLTWCGVRHPYRRSGYLVLASWLVWSGLLASDAISSSTIISTGFEPPTNVTGPLQGQPGGPNTWAAAGSASTTATVQTSIKHSGAQAVQVVKAAAANTDRRWAVPVGHLNLPSQRFIIVDWDMRVTRATVLTENTFGPFFGVDTYDATVTPKVLGSFGVDATTGDVLFQEANTGILIESSLFATFDQWHHYRIVMDFADDTFDGYFDGNLAFSDEGFVDGGDVFTDADIATFAVASDSVSQTKSASAVFDNFVVRDGVLGDYDIDGDVDDADYTRWRNTFGNLVSPAGNLADGSRNGVVDGADYVVWRDNRNTSIFPGAAAGGTFVPEPTTAVMLFTGVSIAYFSLLARPRRFCPSDTRA